MAAPSPSAYLTSVLVHGTAVIALLVVSSCLRRPSQEQPHIIELVAGEGFNYLAKEAPAEGTPGAALQETVPEPSSADYLRDMQRIAKAQESKVVQQFKREQKALAEQARREEAQRQQVERERAAAAERQAAVTAAAPPKETKADPPKSRQMSKAEFDRMNQGKTSPAQRAPKAPAPVNVKPIDGAGIASGVRGGSTANTVGGAGGTALSRAEDDARRLYIAMITERIRRALENAGFNDLLQVSVEFRVSRTGTISQVQVRQSSGSPDFDRSVLDAFNTVPNLGAPPPGPDRFQMTLLMRERN